MPNQTNIGIPPYIQQNTSGDTFSNNTFDPETGTEMQALNRKQQIANLLVQQSLAPRQGQMVGNVYVPAGWGQGAAQLGQALAGAYMTRKNDKARANLESQSNQNVANAMTAYQESQQGKPALTVPEGSQGPERPEMPATHETQRQGLARLMANQNPAVQRFAQYEAQRQAKQAELKAQQEQAMALEAAKAKSAAQLKGIPSADAQAQLAQQAQLHAAPSGNTLAQIDAKKAELATVPAATAAQIASQQQMHAAPSGTALAGIDAQQAIKNAELQQRQAEMTQQQAKDQATLAQQAELKKAELAQQAQLHAAPSGTALAQIDAQGAIQNATLQQRQAEFEQKRQQDLAQLELEKGKFANHADFNKAKLALESQHQQQQVALQRELHTTPSGNTLANVDAQAQLKSQDLAQRQTELAAKQKQDMAALALEKNKFANQSDFQKAKLALEAKHQGEQNAIAQERNRISEAFHTAQVAKGAGKVDDKKEVANYNAGLKEVAKDQQNLAAAAALKGTLQRWVELQDKVETGPVMGRRPISFNPDYQELKSLEDKLGVNNFKPGQGAMSNFERTLIKGSGPSTLNDAPTNKNIAQVMLGGLKTMEDQADFREWYLEQHGKTLGADKQWNEYVEKHPRYIQDKAGNIVPNEQRPDWLSYFSGGQQPAPTAPPPSNAPVQTAQATPTAVRGMTTQGGPAVGTVKGGYVFKGGNPADKASWEKQ